MPPKTIADLLRASGLLNPADLQLALERAASTGEELVSVCWSLKLAPEAALVKLLCGLHGYPGIDLSGCVIRLSNLELVPEDVMRSRRVLPVLDSDGKLLVAMADPDDAAVFDQLRFLTGRSVMRHVAIGAALQRAIEAALELHRIGEQEWRGRGAWKAEPPPEGKAAVVHPSQPLGRQQSDHGLPLLAAASGAISESSWLDEFFAPAPPLAAPAPAPAARPQAAGPDAVGAGKTVLAVDDDPDLRALELKLLKRFSCRVVEAADGRQALALARQLRPEVVLLDAMLPGMHGFEVCQAIKGDPELWRTRIVMVSGIYTGWRIGADIKETYGADYFFEKPFRVDEVAQAVRTLLLEGEGAEAAASARREEAVQMCRGASGLWGQGRPQDALAMLQAALRKDPFSFEPHYYLARLLEQLGQPYEALAELERAVDLRPDLDQVALMLGDLYLKLGFRKTAREVFLRAADVCRDPARAAEIQGRLAKLG